MLAMAPDPMRRFTSMEAATDAMRDETKVEERVEIAPTPAKPSSLPAAARRWPLVLVVFAAVAVGVAIGASLRRAPAPVPSSTPSATASAMVVASIAPTAPVASSAPLAPSSSPIARALAPVPTDYRTDCVCNSEGSALCARGSILPTVSCSCENNGSSVIPSADASVFAQYTGPNLVEGQKCHGFSTGTIPEATDGHLANCVHACKVSTFAGLHRTICHGTNPRTGLDAEGLLYCF